MDASKLVGQRGHALPMTARGPRRPRKRRPDDDQEAGLTKITTKSPRSSPVGENARIE